MKLIDRYIKLHKESELYEGDDFYPPLAEFLMNHQTELSKELVKPPKRTRMYLLTFTHDSSKSNKETFKEAVLSQLKRELFSDVLYSFEHEDTNIHCHARVIATHSINASNFKSHIRKHGFVDVRNIKVDNGITEYISKETTPIHLKKEPKMTNNGISEDISQETSDS